MARYPTSSVVGAEPTVSEVIFFIFLSDITALFNIIKINQLVERLKNIKFH